MSSIIITGATSGIGYQCAFQMARIAPDQQIIIAARDAERARATIKQISGQTDHQHLLFMELDLASLASIRTFRDEIVGKGIQVGYLVNNAGLQNVEKTKYTKDGYEEIFGVNHIGTFYLTVLLLPAMTADARITFTSSGTHDPKQKTGMPAPEFKDAKTLAYPKESSESPMALGQKRYTTSKLCNILSVYELQKRLAKTNIHVNAFDPGFVPGTGLARDYSPFLKFVSDYVFKILILLVPNVHTAKTSGRRLANLAFSPAYSQAKGKYFEGEKEIRSSEDSYSETLQQLLWSSTVDLLHLDVSAIV